MFLASSTLSNQNNVYEYFESTLSKDALKMENSNELITLERSRFDINS